MFETIRSNETLLATPSTLEAILLPFSPFLFIIHIPRNLELHLLIVGHLKIVHRATLIGGAGLTQFEADVSSSFYHVPKPVYVSPKDGSVNKKHTHTQNGPEGI